MAAVEDFQDSPDDEENTRSSHEYLNDLEEEYQARALLAKSKRFFKKEEVSSDDNEMMEVKVLMALAEENNAVSKEGARNSEWKRILGVDQLTEDPSSSGLKDLVFVKSSANDTKVTIPGVKRPWLSEAEGFIMPNHDTATDYDSTDESSVCSTPLPPLKKLDGVKINKPSPAPAKGNKSSPASKVNSAPAGKLKSVKIKDDPLLAIVMKELNDLKLQITKNQSSYSRSSELTHLAGSELKTSELDTSELKTSEYRVLQGNRGQVHNSEDTLEIAEITRKKMNDKIKDPECVKKRVKIAPPDYSRENYLSTFTPQKQLTLEQIFWPNDLIEMKAKDLKEQTKAS
ncbi:hypothetical protein Tco_1321271 [Tanacetum coccineum]